MLANPSAAFPPVPVLLKSCSKKAAMPGMSQGPNPDQGMAPRALDVQAHSIMSAKLEPSHAFPIGMPSKVLW